jgi:hypothetical protein
MQPLESAAGFHGHQAGIPRFVSSISTFFIHHVSQGPFLFVSSLLSARGFTDSFPHLGSGSFVTVTAVPEPSTLALAGMGIAGAVVHQVRRRKGLPA